MLEMTQDELGVAKKLTYSTHPNELCGRNCLIHRFLVLNRPEYKLTPKS
jgi:hypothetical protein